jgi:hypothetical protein
MSALPVVNRNEVSAAATGIYGSCLGGRLVAEEAELSQE